MLKVKTYVQHDKVCVCVYYMCKNMQNMYICIATYLKDFHGL